MKLERINAAAQIELPKARPLSLSQRVSKSSALLPERKRTNEMTAARTGRNVHAALLHRKGSWLGRDAARWRVSQRRGYTYAAALPISARKYVMRKRRRWLR